MNVFIGMDQLFPVLELAGENARNIINGQLIEITSNETARLTENGKEHHGNCH